MGRQQAESASSGRDDGRQIEGFSVDQRWGVEGERMKGAQNRDESEAR